ncbi:MAG TPA: LysR substrate-binding domain-containing protein [Denitromonas sp.]|nr:LysR substrate-binding domain-containing protein [Denitromonas sp.]HQU88140.1 LysR substrate-binding domain-containing protein [Denitromonas sp.]
MKITLRQLQVFLEVARADSVSRAAERLAMSQSAVSSALGELERQFDTLLFDRVGRVLRLNTMGEQLLPQVADLLDRSQAIEDALAGRAGYGRLRIGATLTIGNYLATLLVARFLQIHPDSRVDLKVHNTASIIERLAAFELDLGLIEGTCSHPDLEVETWVADELAVFCAPTHPLAGRGDLSVDDLRDVEWIVREAGSGTRATFEQAFRRASHSPRVRLSLEHTEAIKRAVEFGLGVGCLSRLALRDAFRRGSLVPLSVPGLDLLRSFQFVWHRQKYQSAGMREFLALCRAMTANVRRSDEIDIPFVP